MEKRVGESDDKSVLNRQRQGTMHRCDMIITCAQILSRDRHTKARMTELIMSDETLEERVNAVGKNVTCILCFTREMCRIECGHPGKLLVDVMQGILRTMTTMRRGRPY